MFLSAVRDWVHRGSMSIVTAVLVLSAVLAGAGCQRSASGPGSSSNSFTSSPLPATIVSGPAKTSYADVVNAVTPAVVTVRSERRVRAAQQFPFLNDPFFGDLFGNRQPNQRAPEEVQRGLGSGVIVSADGQVLTNHHVIDGAEDIRVDLIDGRSFKATLVGSDAPSDLALLKIDASGLPVLPLGNSDQVRVGDVVLAVGNPLGIGQTVTMGIISAKGRSTGLSDGSFEDFLQTDAPINQGNSGGALVNTNGELIGINSQILSTSGGNIGIGFAIPANMARSVSDQLARSGKVRRGILGVTIQPITSDLAASLGLKESHGALVNSVSPGSAAARAGIERGDVITGINGQPVADSNFLRNQVAQTQPGTEITLNLIREGKEIQKKVTLGERPVDQAATPASPTEPRGGSVLGLRVEPLTPELAARLGLGRDERGLAVIAVDSSGPAQTAGLQEGDVIQEVNRQRVRSVADLTRAASAGSGRPLLLLVNRGGNAIFLTMRPR
ncbi:MAG TPA: DegQ family serine endoprotease [Terriglobia bacterium]|nr:DegQ family serine endoprotease [Terriglobia bacterium]